MAVATSRIRSRTVTEPPPCSAGGVSESVRAWQSVRRRSITGHRTDRRFHASADMACARLDDTMHDVHVACYGGLRSGGRHCCASKLGICHALENVVHVMLLCPKTRIGLSKSAPSPIRFISATINATMQNKCQASASCGYHNKNKASASCGWHM